jgi:methylated-DNA-[protein]-cysteine S-methyltransferase
VATVACVRGATFVGKRMTNHFFIEQFSSPLGRVLLVTDDADNIRALDWEDHAERLHRLMRRYEGPVHLKPRAAASAARHAIEAYFEGALTAIDTLPVKTGGTAFQSDVWAALRSIPNGETTTYGTLAAQLGRPKAVRAVGAANGANPISIIVPCHRVIGADTTLTGYGGGLERKRWLLHHEGALPPRTRMADQ